ncbi:MAG: hypothetical protein NTV21_05370 [Planctomycetota bacterium]|nr:hypothetical protein [Planctomycetota bacterium]
MKINLVIILSLTVLASVVYFAVRQQPVVEHNDAAAANSTGADGGRSTPAGDAPEVVTAQSVYADSSWAQFVTYDPNRKGIRVHNDELDPVAGTWHSSSSHISWPYPVRYAAFATPNRLFALGEGRNGTFIIESVAINAPAGAYDFSRIVGGPTQSKLVGGQFIAPGSRDPVTVDREELFRSSSYGEIVAICPDPDSRFVLCVALPSSGGAQALRIDVPTGDVSIVADQTAVPTLPFIGHLGSVSHATRGLAYVGLPNRAPHYMPQYVVFIDADRNGQIDQSLDLSESVFELHGYFDPSQLDGRN